MCSLKMVINFFKYGCILYYNIVFEMVRIGFNDFS